MKQITSLKQVSENDEPNELKVVESKVVPAVSFSLNWSLHFSNKYLVKMLLSVSFAIFFYGFSIANYG